MIDYENFFGDRVQQLRDLKKISARKMSLDIGQNASYINHIENNKNFPTMENFFYICDYLKITPEEFFAMDNPAPHQIQEITKALKTLKPNQLETIIKVITTFQENNQGNK